MNKKIQTLTILFIILFQLLKGEDKSALSVIENFNLLSTFESNMQLFDHYRKYSNMILTNIVRTNFQIISNVLQQTNVFTVSSEKAAFLSTAADLYFKWNFASSVESYHRFLKSSSKLWGDIIHVELSNISLFDTSDYSNYSVEIRKKDFRNALKMDRYCFNTFPFRDIPYNSNDFLNRYKSFNTYYKKGFYDSKEFGINMLIYFIETGQYSNARTVADKVNLKFQNLLYLRLEYLKIQTITNRQEKLNAVKTFIRRIKNRKLLLKSKYDAYFNTANEIAFFNIPKYEKTIPFYDFSNTIDEMKLILELYGKALKGGDHPYEYNYNLAMLYHKINRPLRSLFYFEEALKQKTTFEVVYAIGLTHLKLKNYSKAYGYFIEADIYKPDVPEILNNLAISAIHHHSDKIQEKAAYYIDKAIEKDSENYKLYTTKAYIAAEQKQYHDYTNHIESAVKILTQIEKKGYKNYVSYFFLKRSETNKMPQLITRETNRLMKKIGN